MGISRSTTGTCRGLCNWIYLSLHILLMSSWEGAAGLGPASLYFCHLTPPIIVLLKEYLIQRSHFFCTGELQFSSGENSLVFIFKLPTRHPVEILQYLPVRVRFCYAMSSWGSIANLKTEVLLVNKSIVIENPSLRCSLCFGERLLAQAHLEFNLQM